MNNTDVYSKRLADRHFSVDVKPLSIFDDNIEHGEITGEEFAFDEVDRGMPIRSNFNPSKNDKKISIDNTIGAFSIFEKKQTKKLNPFDPYETVQYSNLNETVGNSNYTNIIDTAGVYLFENTYITDNVILPLNFVNVLCCLYVASKGKTTIELQKYLSLPTKQQIFNNLQIFGKYLKSLEYINLNQFIILPYSLNINKSYVSNMSQLRFLQYSTTNVPEYESEKINQYITSTNKTRYATVIRPHHITHSKGNNKPVICLITGTIRPQWKVNFDGYYDGIFGNRKCTYLVAQNKQFNYYKDDNVEAVMINSFDDKLTFGIICDNENRKTRFELSVEYLSMIIDNSDPRMFSQLLIPQIKKNYNLRYTNLMKSAGVETIFKQCEIPECINSNIYISDIVQSVYIAIDRNQTTRTTTPIKVENRQNMLKMRVMSGFRFFIRLNELNCFLVLGSFV